MEKQSQILTTLGPEFKHLWKSTDPADDDGPMPKDGFAICICDVTKGSLKSTGRIKPKYVIEFTVIEGVHKGRTLWRVCPLTEKRLSNAKRDLAKIGIKEPKQLGQPIVRIRCNVIAAVRLGIDGKQRNNVHSFTVIQTEPSDLAVSPKKPLPKKASRKKSPPPKHRGRPSRGKDVSG